MRDSRGITLIELLVVASIIGILAIALGFTYQGWIGNYRIESETKTLYADLMDARARAMTRTRVHFVVIDTTNYTVYDDTFDGTNPDTDGNGTLEDASDTEVLQKTLPNEYELLMVSAGAFPQTLAIDTRGLITPEIAFRIDNTMTPDYDCIVVGQTRVQMGKMSGGSCGVK